MNITTVSHALNQIRSVSKRVGIDVPAELTDDLERIKATAAEVERAATVRRDEAAAELAAAMRAALTAGRDPFRDKAVTAARVAVAAAGVPVVGIVREWADEARAAALRDHLPALLSQWSAVIDEAQRHIAAVREAAPTADLTDRDAGSMVPVSHATSWGMAVEGCRKADLLARLWQDVARASGAIGYRDTVPALILADLDAFHVSELGRDVKAAHIAQKGHRLELATVEQYKARAARVAEQRAAAEVERKAARAVLTSAGVRPDGSPVRL